GQVFTGRVESARRTTRANPMTDSHWQVLVDTIESAMRESRQTGFPGATVTENGRVRAVRATITGIGSEVRDRHGLLPG
ncbi:MAG: hypothetical protein KGL00_02020, partial [Gammaproteobacteria bacterium]|nr:hypothetical protein [Gammaproteobacteria bacterium]